MSVALAVARDAIADARRRGIDVASLPSVFASAYGDLAIVDYLAATLADDPLALSPTRFHLSVHNAASGYWSIATGDRAPSTALAGGDDTFALGLLEVATLAATVDGPALLVVFDTPATGRLVDAVDSRALFGFAIVVAPAHGGAALARVSLALRDGRAPMPAPVDADVRALAATSPAAHALSFAEAIARGGIGLLDASGRHRDIARRARRRAAGRRDADRVSSIIARPRVAPHAIPPMPHSTLPASPTAGSHHDVLIAGGGLAGLTLALQLRDAMPSLDVRVVERRAHPAPDAAHKIGESSVEIGAHYFAETLGLRAHLDERHLRKFGFRFFFSEGERDLAHVTELGASRFMSTPSWQIDRGVFENFLAEEAVRRGARFDDATTVRRIDVDAARSHDRGREGRRARDDHAPTG